MNESTGRPPRQATSRRSRPGRTRVVAAVLFAVTAACSAADSNAGQQTTIGLRDGGEMRLTSSAFEDGGDIPSSYTCDGADVSPPLALSDLPAGAQSLVLIMDDPDAPGGTWDHWVAFNIPVITEIPEDVGSLGTGGRNSWGREGYGGPCPPGGVHRYIFTVYALDRNLELAPGATKSEVLDTLADHALDRATLMGRYGR